MTKSNKEIPTEMTGRTYLILQDGDPDPAAIHTGRRADPELSKGEEPDLLWGSQVMGCVLWMLPFQRAKTSQQPGQGPPSHSSDI